MLPAESASFYCVYSIVQYIYSNLIRFIREDLCRENSALLFDSLSCQSTYFTCKTCDLPPLTPLYLAANNGHAGFDRMLLERGARVDVRDDQGRAQLHLEVEISRPRDCCCWRKGLTSMHVKMIQACESSLFSSEIQDATGIS